MFTLNCRGRLLAAEKAIVMGIINVTPDSFYPGSRFTDRKHILLQAEKMLREGAAILDVGGQSTRPGSRMISPDEEKKRVIPVIESLCSEFPDAYISIDSFYSDVVREAVAAGAELVNDISAGSIDENLIPTVSDLKVPYVLMHMKGTPLTMQKDPVYENVTREVLDFFIEKTAILSSSGIPDIILDPGIGFGKTIQHNFELLKSLEVFTMLEKPVLIGVSRKSTIWKTLHIEVEQALNGTTVLNTIGLMNGASILRVHDVKEAMEAILLVSAMKE